MSSLRIGRGGLLGFFIAVFSVFVAAGCGGGGSGGGEDVDFKYDACQAIGLKIANGENCSPGQTPSASSIVELTILDDFGGVGICTGTAIDTTAVLTAGHCFLDGYQRVDVGTFAGTQTASRVVVHPGFSAVSFLQGGFLENDAAIVFVPSPLGVQTSPILLSRAPTIGEEAIVSGFGDSSQRGGSGVIRAGNALVSAVTAQHVFTEFTGNQSHPCPGDSGSPLLVEQGGRFAVSGIVSQSDPSVPDDKICAKGDVTLFYSTQNSPILSFIRQWVPGFSSV